jgi:hypothetical protein
MHPECAPGCCVFARPGPGSALINTANVSYGPAAAAMLIPVGTLFARAQWGDIATWVGGIATAAALILTYWLLRITLREQRRLQTEQRQAQARLVSAWASQIERTADGPRYSVTVTLKNNSDEPIYGLRAAVGPGWSARDRSYTELDLVYVMPPKSHKDEEVSIQLHRHPADAAESLPVESLPVELIFSDTAGRFWHRDRNGELTQIIDERPPSGGKHFFKATPGAR